MSRYLLLSAACLLTACTSIRSVPPPAEAPEPAAPAAAELPRQIRWVRYSAEHRAVYEQTYRLATTALERRVAELGPGGWAVIVDADETLIDNSLQSAEAARAGREGYHEEYWDRWVERRAAPALPGARRFLERVHALGGRIAVVTNRRQRHCPQTADNLRAQELPFDIILCRTETRDKAPRWRSVEDGTASAELGPLEIVMWVGDNIHDFPGLSQEARRAGPEAMAEFGDRFFVLPNPLYGSWEHGPPE